MGNFHGEIVSGARVVQPHTTTEPSIQPHYTSPLKQDVVLPFRCQNMGRSVRNMYFLKNLFRWSVDDRSPIDFVRIFFLYLLIYLFILYLFLFLPYTFLYTRSLEIDMVNFLQISVSLDIKPYDFKSNQLFQGH